MLNQSTQKANLPARTLIIGCGNASRSDDSVGLHIINEINRRLGKPPIAVDGAFLGMADSGDDDGSVVTVFVQQLGPELADMARDYDTIIFVDAHTGVYAEDVRVAEVTPAYVTSAFSHHIEPAAIVELTRMLYGREPHAFAVSVRGYDFQFGSDLSDRTRALAEQALARVMMLLEEPVSGREVAALAD